MRNEVKVKTNDGSSAGHWGVTESGSKESRKKCPKRGKRYSRAQKDEILQYARETAVADAADKFDVSETTIYEWRPLHNPTANRVKNCKNEIKSLATI